MKISFSIVTLALFAQVSVASWGLSNHIYNKWHQTELERWLDDHDISYPAASDRKELENLVKQNWESNVVTPYYSWDSQAQLDYLKQKGVEVSNKQAENKDWLLSQIKKSWYETESKAEEGFGDVKTWVFDTWTDSELKSFLDYNNIPNPSPRKRDSMISTARNNYATIAKKAGETAAYPGDWLYQSWSESDLKDWLDSHGYPAPQTGSRDKLIAAVRRNSRQAGLKYNDVKQKVIDNTINSWSDSDFKKFFDENGIPVPQNGKRDEYLALARKHKASLVGDNISASMTSAYGAATSGASNMANSASSGATAAYNSGSSAASGAYNSGSSAASGAYNSASSGVSSVGSAASGKVGKVTDAASSKVASATDAAGSKISSVTDAAGSTFAQATDAAAALPHNIAEYFYDTWSDSRLKAYLDSRGVPVPQNGKRDELLALARLHKHKAATGYGAWTFDTWTVENLKAWMKDRGQDVGDATPSRDELASSASAAYASASATGGSGYASLTSALAKATDYAKDTTFDTWTDSDLKAYLDSYGVKTYQGTTKNELIAQARQYSKQFKDGFRTETAFERFQRQAWSAYSNVMYYLGAGKQAAVDTASSISASPAGYASTASGSAASAASVASKSASSAAAAASKSASSAASIVSKHASSAKSEL